MSYLRIPNPYVSNYPLRTYTTLDNLRRITEFNRGQMDEWILRTGYNLNNSHPLVNLLQLLSIDSSWSLEDLIIIVKHRQNSVCSICGITNINRNAEAKTNVFYKDTYEVLFSVYNDRTYVEEKLNISDLTPIIPTYINDTFVDYNASIERTSDGFTNKNKFAFIGIDVVELAIGWWWYMRNHQGQGTGIHAYLVNYPLRKAALVHNELNIVNSLYDFCFYDKPFAESVQMEYTAFFTLSEESELRKYLTFLQVTFSQKRITHLDQLVKQIFSIYEEDISLSPYSIVGGNKGMIKQLDNFNNLRWVLDAMMLKIIRLYLHYANREFYRAGDINTMVSIQSDKMIKRYRQLNDRKVAEHLTALVKEVIILNELNMN